MAVDSSFFYGYLITQIPGGFLASIFPANRIFGTAIAVSAFLNLSVPGAMSLDNVTVLCIIRVLQGLVEVSIEIDQHEILKKFVISHLKQYAIYRVSHIQRVMVFGGFGHRHLNALDSPQWHSVDRTQVS